jgi:hypothetical protein
MLDLFFREQNVSVFGEKFLEVESDMDLFLTQIQMILTTPKGSVYNNPQFGNALNQYLHELNADAKEMKSHIDGQIKQFCPLHRDIPFDVDIKFFKGNLSDLVSVEITIDGRRVLGIIVS